MADEYDDAWAGGDDDADFDDPAGAMWADPQRGGTPDTSPEVELPPGISPRRRSRRRMDPAYDRPPDPRYHRDRAHRGEYGEYEERPRRDWPMSAPHRSPGGLQIPYWQILLLVILGIVALLAGVLACVSVLAL
jgi:hypothetical protein